MIKPGAATAVNFRNPFNSTVTFAMSVDNRAFHVGKAEEQVRARKEARISVTLDQAAVTAARGAPVTGKLMVSCAKPYTVPNAAAYHWLYYLRGVTPEPK